MHFNNDFHDKVSKLDKVHNIFKKKFNKECKKADLINFVQLSLKSHPVWLTLAIHFLHFRSILNWIIRRKNLNAPPIAEFPHFPPFHFHLKDGGYSETLDQVQKFKDNRCESDMQLSFIRGVFEITP